MVKKIIRVKDSIPWVPCASMFTMFIHLNHNHNVYDAGIFQVTGVMFFIIVSPLEHNFLLQGLQDKTFLKPGCIFVHTQALCTLGVPFTNGWKHLIKS